MREILISFFKTSGGSVLTLLFGVVTSKIIAVNLGPIGIGLFSILRQTRDTLLMLTTFNGRTAIVQGLASRQENERHTYSFIVSAIIFLTTIIVVIMLLLFAPLIAKYTLHNNDHVSIWLIRGISIPLIFSTGMMLYSGILNGYRAIGRLAIVQVSASATSMLIAYPITIIINNDNPFGFVWMMSISTCIGFMTAYIFARKANWVPSASEMIAIIDKNIALENSRSFLSFAITTLTTGFASTLTVLAIRSMIVSTQGLGAAGIFDVAWTLSMMYLTIVLTSFGTYYMPTFSQFKEISAKNQLITRILRLTVLIVVPLIISMIVLKPLIVQLLYSSKFLYSLSIIRWMLIGDYLKSTSWVFGVTIVATADKRSLFWSEILFQIMILTLASVALIQFDNLEGIGIAFDIIYFFYLAFTFYYVRKNFRFNLSRSLTIKWIVGFFIILGASLHTWSDTQVKLITVVMWIIIALSFSWLSLTTSDRKQIYAFIQNRA